MEQKIVSAGPNRPVREMVRLSSQLSSSPLRSLSSHIEPLNAGKALPTGPVGPPCEMHSTEILFAC